MPHPRLPQTVERPAEPTPHDLPEPVTTTPSRAPVAPRKRALLAFGAVAVLASSAAGSWLAPRFYKRAPEPAAVKALATPPAAGEQKLAAASASTAAAKPAAPPTRQVASSAAAPTSTDSGVPWLDGAVTDDCVPAAIDAEVPSLQDQAKAQQHYAKGRRLLVQGKLADSLRAFCESARLNPRHSGLAFEVARAALIARDAVTASRFAERSLALTPPDRRSRELLADALAWQGQVEAARSAWFDIHKVSAPTEKNLANLALGAVLEARIAAKQGDYSTAERYLRRALAFGPENVATTTELTRVLLQGGHPEAAARWAKRALELDATDPERHVLAGDIQHKLGHHSAAAGHYSRALELDPNHAVAKLRMRAPKP